MAWALRPGFLVRGQGYPRRMKPTKQPSPREHQPVHRLLHGLETRRKLRGNDGKAAISSMPRAAPPKRANRGIALLASELLHFRVVRRARRPDDSQVRRSCAPFACGLSELTEPQALTSFLNSAPNNSALDSLGSPDWSLQSLGSASRMAAAPDRGVASGVPSGRCWRPSTLWPCQPPCPGCSSTNRRTRSSFCDSRVCWVRRRFAR